MEVPAGGLLGALQAWVGTWSMLKDLLESEDVLIFLDYPK